MRRIVRIIADIAWRAPAAESHGRLRAAYFTIMCFSLFYLSLYGSTFVTLWASNTSGSTATIYAALINSIIVLLGIIISFKINRHQQAVQFFTYEKTRLSSVANACTALAIDIAATSTLLGLQCRSRERTVFELSLAQLNAGSMCWPFEIRDVRTERLRTLALDARAGIPLKVYIDMMKYFTILDVFYLQLEIMTLEMCRIPNDARKALLDLHTSFVGIETLAGSVRDQLTAEATRQYEESQHFAKDRI